MDEIGHILREAREAKGFTVEDAANKTRINERFIEALEEGHYDKLPTPAHIRGFLRNYARFLHLDPIPLLDRYQQANPQELAPTGTGNAMPYLSQNIPPIPEIQNQTFFDPVNMELRDAFGQNLPESGLRLAIIAALILTIILVTFRFISLLNRADDGSQLIQAAQGNLLTNEAASFPTPSIDTTNTNEAGSRTNLTPIIIPTAILSPTRPPLPATMDRIRLRLDILERTWVEVTIDGEIVLTGMVTRENGSYEWEALQETKILTGNASGLFVTINDIELGRLGNRNQVVNETWSVTSN